MEFIQQQASARLLLWVSLHNIRTPNDIRNEKKSRKKKLLALQQLVNILLFVLLVFPFPPPGLKDFPVVLHFVNSTKLTLSFELYILFGGRAARADSIQCSMHSLSGLPFSTILHNVTVTLCCEALLSEVCNHRIQKHPTARQT